MMRDHVVERRVARARGVHTPAHRTADELSNEHSSTGRTNNHFAQSNIAPAKESLVKNACQKAGTALLSFMLALTMMPSAGIAFAAEISSGGVQR